MKNEELKNVRGSIDYGGKDAMIRSFISRTLQETFQKYGYSPLETSILCYYDLLALKYDDDNDILKEIYKVSDQGNRNLALRYDLTVPFAKYIASNANIRFPYKRYEIGKVFRDGPIKKGRTREFIQCDVDCVGVEGQMIEAELISIFVEGYKKLGIDIIIKYNNRKLMNGIIEACNIGKDKICKVITIIDKIEKLSEQELIKEFNEIGLKANQIQNLFKYLKMEFNELNSNFKDTLNLNLKEGLNELKELNKYISELNLTKYVRFLPTLARGQEYYTGTVFEVYVTDGSLKSSIGGGGRYDNMIGDFIKDEKKYPAVGISFGLDAIFEILKEKQISLSNTDVYIIPMENNVLALKMAEELRKNKISVDIEMTNLKLKKALSIINEKNIPVVIIIGENEIKENKIIIKDMKNNFQICEDLNNYIEAIQGILSTGKIKYKIFNS
jgi:histidyl-tRNA synthetase